MASLLHGRCRCKGQRAADATGSTSSPQPASARGRPPKPRATAMRGGGLAAEVEQRHLAAGRAVGCPDGPAVACGTCGAARDGISSPHPAASTDDGDGNPVYGGAAVGGAPTSAEHNNRPGDRRCGYMTDLRTDRVARPPHAVVEKSGLRRTEAFMPHRDAWLTVHGRRLLIERVRTVPSRRPRRGRDGDLACHGPQVGPPLAGRRRARAARRSSRPLTAPG